jgi:DUF4097 and DUF4098 domain-containing protein YvlB
MQHHDPEGAMGEPIGRAFLAAGTAALVVAGGCAVPPRNGGSSNVSSFFSSGSKQTRSERITESTEGLTEVRIDTPFGDIDVEPGDSRQAEIGAEITVQGRLPDSELKTWAEKVTSETRREGSRLTIRPKKPDDWPRDLSLAVRYHMILPREIGLDLHSKNGHIIAAGSARDVRAESAFGDVELSQIGGLARGKSANGHVTVNGAGQAEVESTFGDVYLRAVQGSATGKTANGKAEALQVDGGAKLHSTFGDVIARKVAGAVDLESSNGRIDASEIDASGQEVRLKTQFGAVHFAGRAGTLTANSSNGAVEIELDAMPRSTDAGSSFGDVTVVLPGSADADIDAHTSFGSVQADGLRKRGSDGGHLHAAAAGGKDWSGRVGAGGNTVRARTSNGSVHLRLRGQ